jgi:aryl-alcohol dehydrogenase-like predicted oxidoreductase
MSPSAPAGAPRCELVPGYTVSRIINGAWQLSRGHRREAADPVASIREMQRLADAGLTTFDCGDIYLGVEELLGKLRQVAPEIQVHTKFVPDRDSLARIDRRHVQRIVDRSLCRLGVERLDLLQFAWWDYSVPRYVEAAGWLDELRQAGKIRLLGATNFDVPHLTEIVEAGVPLATHQVQYSLLDRRPERGMQRFCTDRGIRLLAYGSLGGGFLTGRYHDRTDPEPPLSNRSLVKYRLMIDEFGGWKRFQNLLQSMARIASRHSVDIANVAVRWVLERENVAASIVGAFDASHLDQNLKAFSFELDEEDLARLESFAATGPEGDVYSAERLADGPHAAIMRYNLNRESDD